MTTARAEKYRQVTIDQLERACLVYDKLIMGIEMYLLANLTLLVQKYGLV